MKSGSAMQCESPARPMPSDPILTQAGQRGTLLKVTCALLLGLLVIVVESGAGMGHAQTGAWLHMLLGQNVSGGTVDELNACLRKFGHLAGFGMLGLVGQRAAYAVCKFRGSARVTTISSALPAFVGVSLACAAGICDEVHQSFLPTRHASVADVMLDTLGATVFIATAAYIRSRSVRIRPDEPSIGFLPTGLRAT